MDKEEIINNLIDIKKDLFKERGDDLLIDELENIICNIEDNLINIPMG